VDGGTGRPGGTWYNNEVPIPPIPVEAPNFNCWAQIDLDALASNAVALGSLGPELMAVLKADAYGHGVAIVAPCLRALEVRHYGVATAAEGRALRAMDGLADAQIYVMTATSPADAAIVVENDLIPFISKTAQLRGIAEAAHKATKTAKVHLEIDTGIGRAGVAPEDFPEILSAALSMSSIKVTGVCTHFTWGENAEDARRQHVLFERLLREIPETLRGRLLIHASNSPAAINVPGAHYGMIRPGLLLYGIAPVPGPLPAPWPNLGLRPVLSLHARVLLVRDHPTGATLSYGRTYTLERPARIATIGIGYGDGYSRRLSNIGHVLLPSGHTAPIRGRVCMDQFCIELPEGETLTEGDIVTLVGSVGDSELRAVDIADSIGATPHEITTCLTARVPRIPTNS
jgi:alanine racemase